MTATYEEASTPVDALTRRDAILDALTAAGSPVQGLPTSSPDRGMVEAEATFQAKEASLRAGVAACISPTTAASAGDTWVDADVGWYGGTLVDGQLVPTIKRLPATYAVWSIPLKCPAAAAPLTLQPGDIVQLQAVGGQIFNLTLPAGSAPVVLNSGSSYKATATFTARLRGVAAGNVTPGTITAIITGPAALQIDDGSTQVLVTSARDAETSEEVILRALGALTRPGAAFIRQSFDFLIPSFAPTVEAWIVRDDNPYGPGTVGVVLTDKGATATDGEVAAVSAGLNSASVRPLGSGAITVTKALTYTLVVTAALANDGSNAALHADALAVLTLLEDAFPLGGTLDPSLTTGLLRGDQVGTVSILLYDGTSKQVRIDAPGFASVTGVTVTGAAASPVALAWNQRLDITPAITP